MSNHEFIVLRNGWHFSEYLFFRVSDRSGKKFFNDIPIIVGILIVVAKI
jgi:hypothetical protein